MNTQANILTRPQGKQRGTPVRACIFCVSHEHKLIIIVFSVKDLNYAVILKCAINNICHRKDNVLGEGTKVQSLPASMWDLCE